MHRKFDFFFRFFILKSPQRINFVFVFIFFAQKNAVICEEIATKNKTKNATEKIVTIYMSTKITKKE